MQRHFLTALIAGLLPGFGARNFVQPIQPWRSGTAPRSNSGAAAKGYWRIIYPGISLDMRRYARRYRNAGTLRAKYPFSAKR